MTISAVAADDSVKASTMNSIIAHVNGSPGRAIFTANGTWSVPAGAHKFKVYLAGGGGSGGGGIYISGGESGSDTFATGGVGGSAPLISKIFSGVDIGTTYVITIGAGGAARTSAIAGAAGGASAFGIAMTSNGGGGGGAAPGFGGAVGSAGAYGTSTGGDIGHGNSTFVNSANKGYGAGGLGGGQSIFATMNSVAGWNGICVIEW